MVYNRLSRGTVVVGRLQADDDVITTDDLTVADDLTVTGDLAVNGNSALGNATTDTIGLYGVTGVDQAAALTADAGTVTYTATGTPDYELQTMTTTTPAGFATVDEAEGFVEAFKALQTRVAELEAALDSTTGVGLVASP